MGTTHEDGKLCLFGHRLTVCKQIMETRRNIPDDLDLKKSEDACAEHDIRAPFYCDAPFIEGP